MPVHADLDPVFDIGQARADLSDIVSKLRGIDHGLGVGIVENVPDLVGRVAVVDIDVGHARFERGGQGDDIFRTVAHIERDLVPRLRAAAEQGTGEIVRQPCGFTPCDPAVAMDKGHALRV